MVMKGQDMNLEYENLQEKTMKICDSESDLVVI